MPRNVSDTFRRAFWEPATGHTPIVLLEINHDVLGSPLRFALNTEKVRKKPIQANLANPYAVHTASEYPTDATEFELTVSDYSKFTAGMSVTIELDSGEFHDTSVSSTDALNESVLVSSGIPSQSSGATASAPGRQFAQYIDYLPFPFEVTFPSDEAGREPFAKLQIDNIDTTVSAQLKSLSTPPTAKISIVLADTPDEVEYETPELVWQATDIDQFTVQGTLMGPMVLNVSYPMEDFTPSVFPGIFRGTPIPDSE